ncbi:MAG: bifunctional acetate--CoA ligase family protein/GNAT family N-acetyltransferase [Solirubrobacterales bacterium]
MSIIGLSRLFSPRSVAVIGASNRQRSFGNVVIRNLLEGNFPGPILPVTPRHQAVAGVLAYPGIADLPLVPDLAVLCTRGELVPEQLDQLGRRGVGAAIVAALDVERDAMLAAARPHGLRVLGAGSLGLLAPRARLNASFAHLSALPGRIAFVSQSGALCTAVLDWARPRGIGFSYFVSLGGCADVDFGDMMDFLANDADTKAILLYVESIAERRDFMPAARAAARNKPLVLIKAGRDGGGQIGPFLSEALAGPDDVFDAAARRAGALRVQTIDELFSAVETLARSKPAKGERLAILANGGGTAMMAVDELNSAEGGEVAALSDETLAKLAPLLPKGWAPRNPVDLGIAAPGRSYAEALKVLAEAPEVDAVMVIHAPNAMADGMEVAQAVIDAQKTYRGSLVTCWIGEAAAAPARRLLAEAGLPAFATIGSAIGGFRHLVHYRRNQDMLLETPPSDSADFRPAADEARSIVARGLANPEGCLGDPDARRLLAAYGIPVVETTLAASGEDAAREAERVGFPVALTVSSNDLPRKWDVGAVALNLESADAVRAASVGILKRVQEHRPDARIDGFAVQRMALRPNARQLMMGIACDPLFGPVLVFGEGGRAVEVVRDHTAALPPLNLPLAQQVIARTRVSRRLDAHGLRPAANRDAIALALVRLSRLLVDNPEIVACDINPLFADEQGVLAVDARIRVAPVEASDSRRFSVMSYPAELEEPATLHDGSRVLLRPIRPEDEPSHGELIARMTPQDLRYRFFGAVRQLQHHQLARLTQIDYDREMAFIATRSDRTGGAETLGVVRTVTDPDNRRGELAILVRSDLKGTGLGSMLVDKIIRYHKARGTGEIGAQVLVENEAMLRLAAKCGFTLTRGDEPEVMECVLKL